jgi:hypothetical protein
VAAVSSIQHFLKKISLYQTFKQMKKLQRTEMKKVNGGVDNELLCLQGCNQSFNACLAFGDSLSFCRAQRNACRLRCLGCNPVCP